MVLELCLRVVLRSRSLLLPKRPEIVEVAKAEHALDPYQRFIDIEECISRGHY
ncbi:hypothetical protein BRI9_1404 [plant metagenome]|uniref:Uncharacterized protein n=1 Tax=plant metagenome TaxID=1297885 RepID=A0A484TBI9_9ZZZZ